MTINNRGQFLIKMLNGIESNRINNSWINVWEYYYLYVSKKFIDDIKIFNCFITSMTITNILRKNIAYL